MDLFDGDKDKQLDLEECVRVMPNVKCSMRAYANVPNPDDLEGEMIESEKLYASDFVKLEFRIEYLNLHQDDKEGYVHTRNFPYLKKHAWHFMLCDAQSKEKIFHFTSKMRVEEKKTKAKRGEDDDFKEYDGSIYQIFSQRIGKAGEYNFEVNFFSDSYIGFDDTVPFTLKLHPDPEGQVDFEYSKEDKNAVQGSTGIQSLFAEEEEGFDSGSEEEKDDAGKKLSETEKLKKRLEEAGFKDAFKGREGSGIVRPEFNEKGRIVGPNDKKKMKLADGRMEGESPDEDLIESGPESMGSD